MAKPLFTDKEITAHKARLAKHERDRGKGDFMTRLAERKNIEKAHELEMIKLAQERAREYLNALIIAVGSKGHLYVQFDQAFASSDKPQIQEFLKEHNTPEARRNLYIILRALTEIPQNWATSAFIRFLRGNGKQKGAKYHGAGLFAVEYGWKENEVEAICKMITQEYEMYSKVLMSYVDLPEVDREMKDKDADYEVAAEKSGKDLRFASCARRDKEFLNKLCGMLEKDGLGPISTPTVKEPKGPRTPKVFKEGDVIRKATLRDLPLPAHVRIPIERLPSGMGSPAAKPSDWTESTIDQVVEKLNQSGEYYYALIGNDPKTAYRPGFIDYKDKDFLDGAMYVGPWKGKILNQELVIKFVFRKPEKKKS